MIVLGDSKTQYTINKEASVMKRIGDDDLLIELNFVESQKISRNGLLKELNTQMNIIKHCLVECKNSEILDNETTDQIIAVQMRKLMCEKDALLKKIMPDFKMPQIKGREISVGNMRFIIPPLEAGKLISLDDWLEQDVAWLELPQIYDAEYITNECFRGICNKLNKKKQFGTLYQEETVIYMDEELQVFKRKNLAKNEDREVLIQLVKESGYANLSIYTFIKNIADKKGAHTDSNYSVMMEIVNSEVSNYTLIQLLAKQLLDAIKKQVNIVEEDDKS